jgi:hypothetical protein
MEGICPLCGAHYYGWALDSSLKHRCDICHVELKIIDDREHIEENQSPNEHPKYEKPTDKTKEENTNNL